MSMSTNINRAGEPRCPVCGHFLVSDGASGWICGRRGGCGAEFEPEGFDDDGNPVTLPHEHAWRRFGAPGREPYEACVICQTKNPTTEGA